MAEPIQANIIDTLKNLFKSFSTEVQKSLDGLNSIGLEIKDPKPVKSNDKTVGALFTAVTGEDEQIHVKILKSSGMKDTFDMYLLGDNGSKGEYPHIKANAIDDKIVEYMDENYPGSTLEEYSTEDTKDFDLQENFENSNEDSEEEDVEQSTSIVTEENESKIQTSTTIDSSKRIQASISKDENGEITLHKIYCNYEPIEVYEDLQDVVYDEEFNDSLTDEPQNFEIIPQDDSFEIQEINCVIESNSFIPILKAAYKTLFDLQRKLMVISYIDGYSSDEVCEIVDYIDIVEDEIHFLLRYIDEEVDCVKLTDIIQDAINEESLIETSDLVSSTYNALDNLACVLELYYNNQPHEFQHLFDEWILTLRQHLTY